MKLDYVGASYAFFAVVLLWDYLAPRLKLKQVRRNIALRLRRDATKKPSP